MASSYGMVPYYVVSSTTKSYVIRGIVHSAVIFFGHKNFSMQHAVAVRTTTTLTVGVRGVI